MTKVDAIALIFIAGITFGVTWWQVASSDAGVLESETCGFGMSSMSRFVYCENGPM